MAAAALLLTLYFFVSLRAQLQFNSEDMRNYYIPWYNHIIEHGRWASLEGSYSNYTPPYLYLLSLFSLCNGSLRPEIIVRLVSVPFIAAAAVLFWSICRRAGCSRQVSLIGAWIALVIPEVTANTLMIGQCDIQTTVFLLLFIRLMMARRPVWAMAAWGLALSMKLQPIFAGPLVLVLLLAGEIPWWSITMIPATYLAMMLPAALAGRPWRELLGVYAQQYGYYQMIAMNVANPYTLLLHWVHTPQAAATVSKVGLVFGGLCTICLMAALYRLQIWRKPWKLIAGLGLTLIVEPYILPKMHDRYFFPGNTLIVLLAVLMPKMAIPACFLQLAALMSYNATNYGNRPPHYWLLPVIMAGTAIVLVLKQLNTVAPRDPAVQTKED